MYQTRYVSSGIVKIEKIFLSADEDPLCTSAHMKNSEQTCPDKLKSRAAIVGRKKRPAFLLTSNLSIIRIVIRPKWRKHGAKFTT